MADVVTKYFYRPVVMTTARLREDDRKSASGSALRRWLTAQSICGSRDTQAGLLRR